MVIISNYAARVFFLSSVDHINFVKKMNRSRSVVLLIAASVTVVAGCHAPDDVADCAALAAFAAGIVYGRDQQQLPW